MIKRKILYIGNKLASSNNAPTTIDTLSVKLVEEGFSVKTASSKTNKAFRFFDMIIKTYYYKNEVDIVLIDTYSTSNFYYAVVVGWLCRMLNKQYIPILHGGNLVTRLKENPKLSKALFANAETNVAPSKFQEKIFKEAGYNNITYIPNYIEIENYTFIKRETVKPKLLWVRAFSEIYNPLLALEIVSLLKSQNIKVSLCMVGPEKDGSLKRCRLQALESELPIIFTEKLQKQEWIILSEKYDFFLNTSNFDNLPVSVIEAMALGLPVISTNVGGMPYLIQSYKNGILVEKNNAYAIANAIKGLVENPALAKTIAVAARETSENYNWQQIKHSWNTLLGAG